MAKKMQKRIRSTRTAKMAKYAQEGKFIPVVDRSVRVPDVDIASYDEKLEKGLMKGRVEIGIFYSTAGHAGGSPRLPKEITEVLQQQADILNELNRRGRERR